MILSPSVPVDFCQINENQVVFLQGKAIILGWEG